MMICPMTACSNKSPVIAGFPSFSFFLPLSFFLSLSLLQPHLFNFISSSPFSFHLFFSALYLFYFFSTLEYFTQYSPPLHHSSGLTLLLPDDQRIPLLSSLATSVSPSSRGCPLINHSSVLLHFFFSPSRCCGCRVLISSIISFAVPVPPPVRRAIATAPPTAAVILSHRCFTTKSFYQPVVAACEPLRYLSKPPIAI